MHGAFVTSCSTTKHDYRFVAIDVLKELYGSWEGTTNREGHQSVDEILVFIKWSIFHIRTLSPVDSTSYEEKSESIRELNRLRDALIRTHVHITRMYRLTQQPITNIARRRALEISDELIQEKSSSKAKLCIQILIDDIEDLLFDGITRFKKTKWYHAEDDETISLFRSARKEVNIIIARARAYNSSEVIMKSELNIINAQLHSVSAMLAENVIDRKTMDILYKTVTFLVNDAEWEDVAFVSVQKLQSLTGK